MGIVNLTYLLSLSIAGIRGKVECFGRIQLKRCLGCLVHKKVIPMHHIYMHTAQRAQRGVHNMHTYEYECTNSSYRTVHSTQHDFKLHLTFNVALCMKTVLLKVKHTEFNKKHKAFFCCCRHEWMVPWIKVFWQFCYCCLAIESCLKGATHRPFSHEIVHHICGKLLRAVWHYHLESRAA